MRKAPGPPLISCRRCRRGDSSRRLHRGGEAPSPALGCTLAGCPWMPGTWSYVGQATHGIPSGRATAPTAAVRVSRAMHALFPLKTARAPGGLSGTRQGTSRTGGHEAPLATPSANGLLTVLPCLAWPLAGSSDEVSVRCRAVSETRAEAMRRKSIWQTAHICPLLVGHHLPGMCQPRVGAPRDSCSHPAAIGGCNDGQDVPFTSHPRDALLPSERRRCGARERDRERDGSVMSHCVFSGKPHSMPWHRSCRPGWFLLGGRAQCVRTHL